MVNLSIHERKVLILGLLSLVVAIVTYGILHSSGTFTNEGWNPGGAIVGFLAALLALDRVYGKTKAQDYSQYRALDGRWWELIYVHEQIALSHVTIHYSSEQQLGV